MDTIRVILASQIYELQSSISNTLAQIEHILLLEPVSSLAEVEQAMSEFPADIILVDTTLDGDGFKATENLLASYPQLSIIIIEEMVGEDTFHKAIVAGAKDVLLYPFGPNLLNEAIVRTYELSKKTKPVEAAVISRQLPKNQKAFVLTVFSPKGGVGKTSTTINLALALERQTKAEVVVIDLDQDIGNVALAMSLTPRYTLTDIINDIHNINPETIMGYLTPHDSGVKVLPVSTNLQSDNYLSAKHVQTIIDTLRDTCDYIVIDMPARLTDATKPAIIKADKLILLATAELATLRNTKAALVSLEEQNYPKEKINIVLNRANFNKYISAKDVSKTLERELYATLREDSKSMMKSLNEGRPVLSKRGKRGLVTDYMRLTHKILREFGQVKKKKDKKK